ncbi:MAG: pantoate--beta-alanine ligase [Armatimonadetes bacterium]|nr:pantoate--beta-alanine ligase [Armatimonadota bacterium]
MKVLRTIAEFRAYRSSVGEVGFVPTMGALHAGHHALMVAASSENEVGVGSIFVNPLQFGPNEDLEKYPRNEAADLDVAESAGIAAMFCPDPAEMVHGLSTKVTVSGVSDQYEGQLRPGHFDGVATIVARLFGIVLPTRAYFGLKDLQQCAVVRTMVRDLCLPVDIRLLETVRELSGLALSSRNAYFSPEDREAAAQLPMVLKNVAGAISEEGGDIAESISTGMAELATLGFSVDYLELVDPLTMVPTRKIGEDSRLIVAARFKGVRLIDNIAIYQK